MLNKIYLEDIEYLIEVNMSANPTLKTDFLPITNRNFYNSVFVE